MPPFEKTWLQRLNDCQGGQPIRKSHIGALCRLLTVPENQTKTDPTALENVREAFYSLAPVDWAILPAQTEQGLTWLNRRPIRKQLSPTQQAILDNFGHFTFRGVEEYSNGWRNNGYPIYRVYSRSGAWFDYCPRPWQIGGPAFEILGGSSHA